MIASAQGTTYMHSSEDTLVRMANQIAKFFAVQGEERAVPGIAEHLKKFWEPRMKTAIFAHVDAGGAGLEPLALKGIQKLKGMYEGSTLLGAAPSTAKETPKVSQPAQQPKAKAKGNRKAAAH